MIIYRKKQFSGLGDPYNLKPSKEQLNKMSFKDRFKTGLKVTMEQNKRAFNSAYGGYDKSKSLGQNIKDKAKGMFYSPF